MRLSDYELIALTAWDSLPIEYSGLSFATVAGRSGLEQHRVRRTVRALARKGLVTFEQALFSEDDGKIMGAGYSLTQKGADELCARDGMPIPHKPKAEGK